MLDLSQRAPDPYDLVTQRQAQLAPQVAPSPSATKPAYVPRVPYGFQGGPKATQSWDSDIAPDPFATATRLRSGPNLQSPPGQGFTGQPNFTGPNPQQLRANFVEGQAAARQQDRENYLSDPSHMASASLAQQKSADYLQGQKNQTEMARGLGLDPSSSMTDIAKSLAGPIDLTDPRDTTTPPVPSMVGSPTPGAGLDGTLTPEKTITNAALAGVANSDAQQRTAVNNAYAAGRGDQDPYVIAEQLRLRRLQRPINARPDLSMVAGY